jgi:D-tyrosyl-tRNA(Tyr) deacylase
MRLIVQRVRSASVTVEDEVVGSIGRGMLVLVGLAATDDPALAIEWGVRKLLNLRLWEDASGKAWASSVLQSGLDVLLVSQFTLHAVLKGNKPDFRLAMGPEAARAMWAQFVAAMEAGHKGKCRISQGRFGAMMDVALVNDGPVTIELDGPTRVNPPSAPPAVAPPDICSLQPLDPPPSVLLLLPAAGACSRVAELERRGAQLLNVRLVACCAELGSRPALAILLRPPCGGLAAVSALSALLACAGNGNNDEGMPRGGARAATPEDIKAFFL